MWYKIIFPMNFQLCLTKNRSFYIYLILIWLLCVAISYGVHQRLLLFLRSIDPMFSNRRAISSFPQRRSTLPPAKKRLANRSQQQSPSLRIDLKHVVDQGRGREVVEQERGDCLQSYFGPWQEVLQ